MFNETFVQNIQNLIAEISHNELDPNDIQFFRYGETPTARVNIIIVDPLLNNPMPYDGQQMGGRLTDNHCIASADRPEEAILRFVTRGTERMPIMSCAPGKIWITCAFYSDVYITPICWSYLTFGIINLSPTLLQGITESNLVNSTISGRLYDLLEIAGTDTSLSEYMLASVEAYPQVRTTRDRTFTFQEEELRPAEEDLLKQQAALLAQVSTATSRRTVSDCIAQITDYANTSFRNDRKRLLFNMSNEILAEFSGRLKEGFETLTKMCQENNHKMEVVGNVMVITIPDVFFEETNIGTFTITFSLNFDSFPMIISDCEKLQSSSNIPIIHPDFSRGEVTHIQEMSKMVAEYDICAIYSIIVDRLFNPKYIMVTKEQFKTILRKKQVIDSVSTPIQAATFVTAPRTIREAVPIPDNPLPNPDFIFRFDPNIDEEADEEPIEILDEDNETDSLVEELEAIARGIQRG